MSSLLPDFADPRRLCSLGKVYEGALPLGQMPRLAPLLTSTEGDAAFVLAFGRDAEKRDIVTVRVEAEVALQCQRCLAPLRTTIAEDARLAVVTGPDEAERLPAELDPLLAEDGQVALRDLVEDELLLALPAAPAHPPGECVVSLAQINGTEATTNDEAGQRSDNPFAALAELKTDGRKPD
jgi:uncharacterized protein